jgi:hypothetical protein
MQGGRSSRLSGKILVLECVRNLLSSINDSDQGLELENLICNTSYGCLCCKNPISMHHVDLLLTYQPSFLKYSSISVVDKGPCLIY